MADEPYARFRQSELILRDELAIDRTLLANENTLLAYLRSAVTLAVGGATLLHFFPAGHLYWLGIASITAGIGLGVFGVWRFLRTQRSIKQVRQKTEA
ncbi:MULTISPECIES: YidH family protein [unclassified Uliginosibacterium]|uniref:YidH family protein n=1 Tax=unclassified Uliginosibacterium TaxID=2621521 RepID=UPI000C79DC25|nr:MULTISPECIES: DUF202 domain-containing protein [unclassified Uliginosibacterium]MDO6387399.1 DUF202 domain-containing protein [Uliginosibacterium sp. 31-12]PLK47195.1 hypothetical protein C0V76_18355 [Uliginosibacterium sp. TH139]